MPPLVLLVLVSSVCLELDFLCFERGHMLCQLFRSVGEGSRALVHLHGIAAVALPLVSVWTVEGHKR